MHLVLILVGLFKTIWITNPNYARKDLPDVLFLFCSIKAPNKKILSDNEEQKCLINEMLHLQKSKMPQISTVRQPRALMFCKDDPVHHENMQNLIHHYKHCRGEENE